MDMTRLIANGLVSVVVFLLDIVYKNRPVQRFWVLETVARVPYFSWMSVLHLYQSLGMWERYDWLTTHYAESYNEEHHLRIFEELGGNKVWADRAVAYHAALLYYWAVVVLYVVDAPAAYYMMAEIEKHAYDTYDKFLNSGHELLSQPAPLSAIMYYMGDDNRYLFEKFQPHCEIERRPKLQTVADVIREVRNDEMQHVLTCQYCEKEYRS
jgi:ubiquinol oxidase